MQPTDSISPLEQQSVSPPEEASPYLQAPEEDQNKQILEQLKDQRDELRGTNQAEASEKKKFPKLKAALGLLLVFAIVGCLYMLSSNNKNNDQDLTTQQNQQIAFVLPANLSSKPSEEKSALSIIDLARKDNPDAIINGFLDKARLQQTEANFKILINSYSASANGASVQLVEKKVGKVDFGSTGESSAIAETSSVHDAASIVYKSSYFNHTNNIYTKINLYKPDPAVDAWKMYLFEFKAADDKSPYQASTDLQI